MGYKVLSIFRAILWSWPWKLSKHRTCLRADWFNHLILILWSECWGFFSGNCNDSSYAINPGGCEHIFDQLLPIQSLDLSYIRYIRYINFHCSSWTINCNIQEKRRNPSVTFKETGRFETRPSGNQVGNTESKQPLLVTRFGLHFKSSDNEDPAIRITPGLDYYKFVVPFGYDFNYVSILMKDSP